MNESIDVEKWVLLEARRALRHVMTTPGTYFDRVMHDDAQNIRAAARYVEDALAELEKEGE